MVLSTETSIRSLHVVHQVQLDRRLGRPHPLHLVLWYLCAELDSGLLPVEGFLAKPDCMDWILGSYLLKASSPNQIARIQLSPAHIFVAAPLPHAWLLPDKLWQILKAILCWQIWKNCNAHNSARKPVNAQKIIQKSWHLLT